jgi:hypothetical protein
MINGEQTVISFEKFVETFLNYWTRQSNI